MAEEKPTLAGRRRAAAHAAAAAPDAAPEGAADGRATRPGRRPPPSDTTEAAAPDTPDRATSIGKRRAEEGDGHATRLGRRDRGPALAQTPPAASIPTWQATARPRRARRGSLIGGAAVTFLIAAAVVAFLLLRQDPLQVSAASVAPGADPGTSCDVTVDVVGTVTTNGRSGAFTYQWLRSDGQASAVLTQSVAEGATSTQVHLMWAFSGSGRYPASATLRVLRPDPVDAVGQFTYSCR